jgi:peptide/nickel transport system substrate-binding protein
MLQRLLLAAAGAIAAAGVLAPHAKAQRRPNEIVWGDQLPGGLNPHVIADVPMQFIQLNTYDEFYRYQGNPPEFVPSLASGHTASADGLTWTVTLRPRGARRSSTAPISCCTRARSTAWSARAAAASRARWCARWTA